LVVLHDLRIRKLKPQQTKYNAAQRISYAAIIFIGLGSVITGLDIYQPVTFSFCTTICGGYEAARLQHFILTIGYCIFFLVHILQIIFAGWRNFQSMITGFQILKITVDNKQVKSKPETAANL
jgi:thiosulfate reductase cytochrome b subunit